MKDISLWFALRYQYAINTDRMRNDSVMVIGASPIPIDVPALAVTPKWFSKSDAKVRLGSGLEVCYFK